MKGQKLLLTAAFLALLVAVIPAFFISRNRLSFREFAKFDLHEHVKESSDGNFFGFTEYARNSAQETIALPDTGFEILESITIKTEDTEALPVGAELYAADGEKICDLQPIEVEIQGNAAAFRIPFRMRIKKMQNLSVLLRAASGEEYSSDRISEVYIYGGFRDKFWSGLVLLFLFYPGLMLVRVAYLLKQKRKFLQDRLLCAMAVAAIAFLSMVALASCRNSVPLDEGDNLIGGMLQVHRGRVLYRDYVTQHMPVAYWLSAGLALLGAKSAEQFRLLFQIVACLIWGAVYYRHFGTKRAKGIALFAFIWGPVSYLLIGDNAMEVLCDNIVGLAMSILLLEMIAYFEDHDLTPGRMAVVSLCLFSSVGSSFISLYPAAVCALLFLAEDIRYYYKKYTPVVFLKRYSVLAAAIGFPFLAAIGYLFVNGALSRAYEMAYQFNIEVYPKYGVELGNNKLKPFYSGVIHIAQLIRKTSSELWVVDVSKAVKLAHSLESLLIICALILLIRMFIKGQRIMAAGIFLFIETQGLRSVTKFHSIMLWYVTLLFVLCYLPGLTQKKTETKGNIQKELLVAGGYLAFFWLIAGPVYFSHVKSMLIPRVPLVSDQAYAVVELAGEGNDVFLVDHSLYVLNKGCYPVNRLLWILPWYMEWYGDEILEDLENGNPKAAVYHPGTVVWGYGHFSDALDAKIEELYDKTETTDVYLRKQ